MSKKWNSDSRGKIIPLIRIGTVVSTDDPDGIGMIRVRFGKDHLDDDKDLLECLPLIPKFLNVFPNKDEAVLVFEATQNAEGKNAQTKRYWMGPMISQLQKLENEPHIEGMAQEPDGVINPGPNITTIKTAKGAYPTKEDIAIQGRDNADIILKPREIWIRAGKFNYRSNTEFNTRDPAYIQLKYGSTDLNQEFTKRTFKKKVFSPPTHLIKTVINSFKDSGESIPNDGNSDIYDSATRNTVSLIVKDIKENNIIYSFDNGGQQYDTRGEAVSALIGEVESQIENHDKWKLLTPTSELLEKFGQDDQLSKLNKVVMYPNNTIEKTESKIISSTAKESTGNGGSVINVVASKINFLSHDGPIKYELTDKDELITTKEQNKINADTHPIVYGDKLVEFLELVKDYINNHTHPYHQDVAVDSPDKSDALKYDLVSILNKNINSN